MRPIVKWAGGKSTLVPFVGPGIFAKLQDLSGRYIEPFVGGGAVALWLGLPRMVISDHLTPLIAMYRSIRFCPETVYEMLVGLVSEGVEESDYYRVRAWEPVTDVAVAARLIYLNRLGYNGLFRQNRSGKFNVPYGDQVKRLRAKAPDADPTQLFPSRDQFLAVSSALQSACITDKDFEAVIDSACKRDVVYADPPYLDTFSGYTTNGFDHDEHRRLAECLHRAHTRGVTVLTSNVLHDETMRLYGWMDMFPVDERRNINANGKGRGKTPCALFTNHPAIVRMP